ncbi:MAG: SDR family NAD(P)-dependent oxidoreductase [Acidimicrobiales bacterium]
MTTTDGRLAGKVAVVTGGGNGIGAASCRRFAEHGAKVVVADVQADRAAETAAAITDAGGDAVSIGVDVTSHDDNEAMAQLAVDTWGGIDIVLTAAGISHGGYVSGDLEADIKMLTSRIPYMERPGWDFVEADLDEWDLVHAVNLKGTLMGMQACASRMLEAGNGGSIVTIASVAAKHPDAGPLAYTSSKAAVWMLTKKAARMLGPAGIRVNAIGPGFIETHMTAVFELIPEDERRARFEDTIPLRRKGRPDEIADAAVYLASDESSYVTGTIIHPDGGYYTD